MIALGTRRVNRYDCGKQTAQNDTESIAAQCLYTRSSNGERATERISGRRLVNATQYPTTKYTLAGLRAQTIQISIPTCAHIHDRNITLFILFIY